MKFGNFSTIPIYMRKLRSILTNTHLQETLKAGISRQLLKLWSGEKMTAEVPTGCAKAKFRNQQANMPGHEPPEN